MKWIGQNIYDQISKFRNTVDFSEDVTFYQPVNNADPKISIGASDDERLLIKVNYQGTASQTAQQIIFKTLTESGTAHDGLMKFMVDEVEILRMQDNGIKLAAGMGIGINGVDILTDNGSGAATLSNIDALDATTIATIEADIDSLTGPIEIDNPESSGSAALLIDNNIFDQTALNIEASNTTADVISITADAVTTGNVIDISCDALTTGSALKIEDNSSASGFLGGIRNVVDIYQKNTAAVNSTALRVKSDGGQVGVLIDKNMSGNGSGNMQGLHIDLDRTVPEIGTSIHNDWGILLDVTSASLGTSTLKGMDINVVGATSGTSAAYGLDVNVSGADDNYGVRVETVGNFGFQHINTATSSATGGGKIQLVCNDGAAMADDHRLGVVEFAGAEDTSNNRQTGARIQAMCDAAWSASENGTRLEFYTMDGNASSELSLTLDSDLLATFAGAVTVTGALTGTLATASQPNITTVGTIGNGVWQGTTIKTAYIGDDQVTEDKLADTLLAEIDANTAKVTNVATNLTATTHASQITINSSDGTNVVVAEASGSIAGVMSVTHHDKLDAIEASATADQSKSDIDGLAITTVGTIDTGVWNGTAIASAYLDADTAHLSSTQTFSGKKAFSAGLTFGGNKDVTPGDGAVIHVDTHDITDVNTSASGTAAKYTHVSIEAPRLMAANESVTTTNAASLYIQGAPVAYTNQTITNPYALWVDDGLVKFDGALTVGGTITGDVTGDLTGDASGSSGSCTGQAATVATIAGLAPNTATTQATQAAITTLAGVTSLGVASATTNIAAGDVTMYNPVNDGNPTISLGSSATERFEIEARYESGAQGLDLVKFTSYTAGSSTDDGRFAFYADETFIFNILDAGVRIKASGNLEIGSGNAILSDSSGTTTLSNIDAIDATTEATIESAIDTLANLTSVGTIGTGVWNGDVIASAYLDADTAHLSGSQTFTGTKTLNSFKGTAGATVTNINDTDAFSDASATTLATSESIKAYADTKRPNLYWFGVCDEATAAANANLGAFPSTDVSIVSFANTTLTNDTDVFTLETDEVTITRAGVYKFTYNVLLEISTGNNRTEGAIGILRDRASTITLVEGSRSSTYNRFGRADSDDVSRMAGSVSMFIDVAVDDIFYIGFFKEAHQTSNTRLQTVPSGTTWTIEAVT
mgnify:CR=1 FL=1